MTKASKKQKQAKNIETQALNTPVVTKRFLCDCCGKEKTGIKHKMYDENWNVQRGRYECDECYGDRVIY